MAIGDTLFILQPHGSIPPSANRATIDWMADASTPNMQIPVLDFDGTADEYADWFVTIPSQYSDTTGFTFSVKYAMDGTDGDAVELEIRVLPLVDLDDFDDDLLMDAQTPVVVTDDPGVDANEINYTTTFTLAKANFGSAVKGTKLCIRAMRDTSYAANPDDLQLIEILIIET